MKFNFKEALESLERSKIMEYKTEKFLNSAFNTLRKNKVMLNDLDAIMFYIEVSESRPGCGALIARCYKKKNKFGKNTEFDFFTTKFVEKNEDLVSMINIIERELKSEGLCYDFDKIFKRIKITF